MGKDEDTGAGNTEPQCTGYYGVPSEPPFVQVSPEASYWAELPILRSVTVREVVARLEHSGELNEFLCEPDPAEITDLTTGEFGYGNSETPFDDAYRRERLGEFLEHPAFIARPPAGTVVNNRVRTGRLPIVRNGAELATIFEAEKTAVWHQHVLLTLLDLPGQLPVPDGKGGYTLVTVRLREVISPVRQALMQAALHIATVSALSIIWRFKWRRFPTNQGMPALTIARRERPSEYFERVGTPFTVLFDSEIRFNADGDVLRRVNEARRKGPTSPDQKPGTPRHPAYGSGHSTYSAAASEVLKVFLPKCWGMQDMPGGLIKDIHGSLDKLANSIGEARLWGGVHWRSDHLFGQAVGRAVAAEIITQLNKSLVNPEPSIYKGIPEVGDRDHFGDLDEEYFNILKLREADPAKPEKEIWNWADKGPYPDLNCDDGSIAVAKATNFQGGRV
ncbi:phosphatase PAP2 family protein [Methylorubrum extorquens]